MMSNDRIGDNSWILDVLGGSEKIEETKEKLQEIHRMSLIWFEKIGAILEENADELEYPLAIRLNTLLDEFGRIGSASGVLIDEFDFIIKHS
ncbi:hypothetical protein DRQ17_07835 [bacterium]|nr:MAG: hypothetical protein DRQ17_07835 [bacterium]